MTPSSRRPEEQSRGGKSPTPFVRSTSTSTSISTSTSRSITRLVGRLPKLFLVTGFGVVLSHLLAPTVAVDANGGQDVDWDNGGIPSNNLGVLASTCSNFCRSGVNGLDLWLTFINACYQGELDQAKFSMDTLPTSTASPFSGGGAFPLYVNNTGWTLVQSMFLCAMVSTFGLFSGFKLGARMASVPKAAFQPIL